MYASNISYHKMHNSKHGLYSTSALESSQPPTRVALGYGFAKSGLRVRKVFDYPCVSRWQPSDGEFDACYDNTRPFYLYVVDSIFMITPTFENVVRQGYIVMMMIFFLRSCL